MIVLPYLSKLSLQIRTRIKHVMRNKLPHCILRIVFQTKCKLINFFTFKDNLGSFCSMLAREYIYAFPGGKLGKINNFDNIPSIKVADSLPKLDHFWYPLLE